MAAIEVESPRVVGAKVAVPVYLQTSLKHTPQCCTVFAKMLDKDFRPNQFNSDEDPNSGKWLLKPMLGRNSADMSLEAKSAPPGIVAGAHGKANQPAAGKRAKNTNARWLISAANGQALRLRRLLLVRAFARFVKERT